MSTMVDARDAITTAVASLMASEPSEPAWYVEWDNLGVPNVDSLTKFLSVEMAFVDGRQADLNARPVFRRFGYLKLYIAVKEYSGTRDQTLLMDYLADNLQTRYIGGALMKAARPQQPITQKGWRIAELWIPFEVDNR